MEDGYLQSGIRMTQWVAQKEHWGLPELEERCKYLTQQAVSLWPYADSSYTPPQKQYEEVSLDDDITLTGHGIVKYRFRGIEHETTSWVEMYTEVLKELHNGNKAYLNYLADADDSVDLSIQVTRSPDEFSSSVKLMMTFISGLVPRLSIKLICCGSSSSNISRIRPISYSFSMIAKALVQMKKSNVTRSGGNTGRVSFHHFKRQRVLS